MVEASEVGEIIGRSAVPLRLHNLLLVLAGRLDDSALGVARRLAARARGDEAAELIAGALVAGRIPVRSREQHEIAAVLAAAGADDWFAEHLYVDDAAAERGVEHRFTGGASVGVAEALEPVLRRLPGVRSVHAVWRNTVAGSVPGPMPQRLVLAEVDPGGSALATAYRMDVALRHAGISAAVEVTGVDSHATDYHRQALAVADPVTVRHAAAAAPPPPKPEPEPAVEPEPEPPPVRQEAAEVPPEPEPEPEPVKAEAEPSAPAMAFTERPWNVPVGQAEEPKEELAPGELFWPQSEPAAAGKSEPAAAGKPEPVPARKSEPAAAGRPEQRAETTAELSTSEMGQLKSSLAEGKAPMPKQEPEQEPTEFHEPAEPPNRAGAEFPAGDLDNPRLSDRDRELLKELHAELAKREREQATQVRMNGWEPPGPLR